MGLRRYGRLKSQGRRRGFEGGGEEGTSEKVSPGLTASTAHGDSGSEVGEDGGDHDGGGNSAPVVGKSVAFANPDTVFGCFKRSKTNKPTPLLLYKSEK